MILRRWALVPVALALLILPQTKPPAPSQTPPADTSEPAQPAPSAPRKPAITFGASATAGSDGSSLGIDLPAGAGQNDVLIAAVVAEGASRIDAPAGWTLIRSDRDGQSYRVQSLYYHVAGAVEPASYTWSFDRGLPSVGMIASYSGAYAASPVFASSGQTSDSASSEIVGSSLMASPGAILLGVFSDGTSTTIAAPAGMRERATATRPRLSLELSDQALSGSDGSGARVARADTPWGYPLIGQLVAMGPGPASYLRGVNLVGPEFNTHALPGIEGKDWTYPTARELDYFGPKGLRVVRLPVLWERMQPKLYGALDPIQLARVDAVVAAARARGMWVTIVPFGEARYHGKLIGSPEVPVAAFADLWTKLATHYAAEPLVSYDLMNEPHYDDKKGSLRWQPAAQAAINAIRAVDTIHTIHVEGDGYSATKDWAYWNRDPDFRVTDSANNFVYDAHEYFDKAATGRYVNSYADDGAYPAIGVERLQPFLDFLRSANAAGYIGEYGVPGNDARWLTVLDRFMTAMDQHGLGGAYWDAGPWQTQAADPLSIEPGPDPSAASPGDQGQVAVLLKHPTR